MDKENQEKTNKSLENEKDTKESLKETETNTEETEKIAEEAQTECVENNKEESPENIQSFEEDDEEDELLHDNVNEEPEENKNKRRNLVIGIAVAVIVFILFCVTTPFNKTEKTVCAPKEKSTLTLKVTMESKNGKVIKLTQEETTKLKKYNMTEKEFKTAAKEIKKGTKTYEGLSYTYEVKDGVGIETLILDTDKASTDTYTLLGLTTKNDKDGKAVKVSTKKAIKSMENYGLECK